MITPEHVYGALGATAAAVTVTTVLWGWIKKTGAGMLKQLVKLNPFHTLRANQAEILAEVKTLKAEFSPNGGSSLRDSINVITGRVEALCNQTPTMMWEAYADGQLRWANQMLVNATERPKEELLGWGWVNAVYQPDREGFLSNWREAIAEQRQFDYECRFLTMNTGRLRKMKIVATPNFANKRLVSWSGTAAITRVLE